jgi:hypothetical protein
VEGNATTPRQLWKLVPASGGKGYNIVVADSTNLFITDYNALNVVLAPGSEALSGVQVFNVVPSPRNRNLVALQSANSGKFIQVQFCSKANQAWGYDVPLSDSSECSATQDITFGIQADTCYCVYQYMLIHG